MLRHKKFAVDDTARNQTKTPIIESFWRLYHKKDVSKITVKDITEATGIHHTTFYLYYDNVLAVMDAIKNEQLEKLKYVYSTYISSDNEYADFLKAMRKLCDENKTCLEPLLCQYRGNEFAVQYWQVMKFKLRTDIDWHQYPEDSTAYLIVDFILIGMIETFVSFLQSRAFPLESVYRFASQSVDNSITPSMEREFGIPVHPSKHIPHFYFNNKRSHKQSANIIKVSHFSCTSLRH